MRFIENNEIHTRGWLFDVWTILNKMDPQNIYRKYLGEKGRKGEAGYLQSLLTFIKGTQTFNLQSNEPPPKFIRLILPYEVPLGKNYRPIQWSLMALP